MIDVIPLSKDASGVLRVGDRRVTLDSVVHAFHRGATAEEIVQDYPTLQLSDVYQVIGYYLKHGSELLEYFQKRESEERRLWAENEDSWAPHGLRKRLLARRERA